MTGQYHVNWPRLLAAVFLVAGLMVGLAVTPMLIHRINPRHSPEAEAARYGLWLLLVYLYNCVAFYMALWASGRRDNKDFLVDVIEALVGPAMVVLSLSNSLRMYDVEDMRISGNYNMRSKDAFLFWSTLVILNAVFFLACWKVLDFGVFGR